MKCAVRIMHLAVLLVMLWLPLLAGEAAHVGGKGLVPIKDTLKSLDLSKLAALPVQHGGRYKPMHSLAMEIIDGVAYSTSFGKGHTPVTSMLDLLFLQSVYNELPIARVKHTELRRDLALMLPDAEAKLLREEGRITPQRLRERELRDKLEELGRITAKTKAINQVRRAQSQVDAGNIVFQFRLFPVPTGPHDDRWRDPAEVGGSFAVALQNFLRAAQQSSGDDDFTAFADHAWSLLPISPETALKLGIRDREDVINLNQRVLWPLWSAAASGKLNPEQATAIAENPAVVATIVTKNPGEAVDALDNLKKRWPALRIPDTDLADAALREPLDAAIDQATTAWTEFGVAWQQARLGKLESAALQTKIDALVTACQELRTIFDKDHIAAGKPVLTITNELEMTYWRFNGFIHWVWMSLLLAVPFLAMGGIGRMTWALWVGYALAVIGFIGQLAAFIIRAELAQRIPLANLYESMAAASLLASFAALVGEAVLSKRKLKTLPVGADVAEQRGIANARGSLALGACLFGCMIVFAQILLEYHDINAFISPAMPILSEFWLRVHTACIVGSYGLIALGGLMSLVYLVIRIRLPWNDPRSEAWDRTTFAIDALAMLVLWVGLVLGAVWAAVSWGRPWGWDPKEVFALLTWVVYIILVHLRVSVRPQNRGIATAIAALAAFVVMAFNWYWVNVQLAGLHSYA